MNIAIAGDIHWGQYSSIVRKRGNEFSYRLENCINSINWFEQLATDCNCGCEVYLGDFFDKNILNAEELTALNYIKWNNLCKWFIVGNHEIGNADLSTSSLHVLNIKNSNYKVIDECTQISCEDNTQLGFIPYILEDNRKPFNEYFKSGVDYVFSHNDLKGIQMGMFKSVAGFDIDEIKCKRFINGHLHNGQKINDTVINIGNLTGQNFSEDATKYDHVAFILDTDLNQISVFENPYAMNFFKIETNEIDKYNFNNKKQIVLTIKCDQAYVDSIKDYIKNNPDIIESRVVVNPEISTDENCKLKDDFTVDHITQFTKYMITTLGSSETLLNELEEIVR